MRPRKKAGHMTAFVPPLNSCNVALESRAVPHMERRPRKVAAVALANKVARVVWAMMARGEVYRRQPVAA